MNNQTSTFLNFKQLQQRLNISKSTMYKAINDNSFPERTKVFGKLLFDLDKIIFLEHLLKKKPQNLSFFEDQYDDYLVKKEQAKSVPIKTFHEQSEQQRQARTPSSRSYLEDDEDFVNEYDDRDFAYHEKKEPDEWAMFNMGVRG